MKKINDRIVGGVFATLAMTAVIGGGVWLASAAPATTEPTVAKVVSVPDVNGLAAEQEAEAAAAEAARVAAETAAAEAARVAAEQAAAAQAEAERVAAEQAAAESESFDEPSEDPAPEPEPEFTGPAPGTQVHTICQVLDDGTQVPCQH